MGSNSAGGVFLPNDPPPSTNQVLTTPSISSPTLTGTMTGTYTLAGTATLTAPTLTAPVISGAATMASGATLTTPTILLTSSTVIATGATGTDAAAVSAVTPAVIYANGTGVSGAGVAIPTGAAVVGATYIFQNGMTGVLKIYAVGGTINGTTGTTAFSLTATGNLMAVASCTTAGAWRISGNT